MKEFGFLLSLLVESLNRPPWDRNKVLDELCLVWSALRTLTLASENHLLYLKYTITSEQHLFFHFALKGNSASSVARYSPEHSATNSTMCTNVPQDGARTIAWCDTWLSILAFRNGFAKWQLCLAPYFHGLVLTWKQQAYALVDNESLSSPTSFRATALVNFPSLAPRLCISSLTYSHNVTWPLVLWHCRC